MPARRLGRDEIVAKGREIYHARLRPELETPEHMGKLLLIDVETGDYELDSGDASANDRLLSRRPDAQVCFLRVGEPVAFDLFHTGTDRLS